MKPALTLALSLFASIAFAEQPPSGLTQQDMNKLMQQAAEMQACMSSLRPETLERVKTSGMAAEAEIKALCAEGKRDEAMEAARRHGEAMAASKDMKAMKKCGDQAMAMMQDSPMRKMMRKEKIGHICDGYK